MKGEKPINLINRSLSGSTDSSFASSELHYAFFQQAPDGMWLSDSQGRFQAVNPRLCELSSYTPEELLRFSIGDLISEEARAPQSPRLGDLRPSETLLKECLLRRKDGHLLPVEINACRLADGALLGIVRDIHQRPAWEQALRESEARYQATLMSIGDGVIATDTAGRVELMNPVAEALTGWTQAEALGRPLKEVFRIVNKYTHAEVENPVQRVLREGVVVGLANHTLLIARDGRECPSLIAVRQSARRMAASAA
jgi:PAS domain S-box-containing protein